jgi:hypothetical protein
MDLNFDGSSKTLSMVVWFSQKTLNLKLSGSLKKKLQPITNKPWTLSLVVIQIQKPLTL